MFRCVFPLLTLLLTLPVFGDETVDSSSAAHEQETQVRCPYCHETGAYDHETWSRCQGKGHDTKYHKECGEEFGGCLYCPPQTRKAPRPEVLARGLQSADLNVQYASALALGKLNPNDPETHRVLAKMQVSDQHEDYKTEALNVLSKAHITANADEISQHLIEAYLKSPLYKKVRIGNLLLRLRPLLQNSEANKVFEILYQEKSHMGETAENHNKIPIQKIRIEAYLGFKVAYDYLGTLLAELLEAYVADQHAHISQGDVEYIANIAAQYHVDSAGFKTAAFKFLEKKYFKGGNPKTYLSLMKYLQEIGKGDKDFLELCLSSLKTHSLESSKDVLRRIIDFFNGALIPHMEHPIDPFSVILHLLKEFKEKLKEIKWKWEETQLWQTRQENLDILWEFAELVPLQGQPESLYGLMLFFDLGTSELPYKNTTALEPYYKRLLELIRKWRPHDPQIYLMLLKDIDTESFPDRVGYAHQAALALFEMNDQYADTSLLKVLSEAMIHSSDKDVRLRALKAMKIMRPQEVEIQMKMVEALKSDAEISDAAAEALLASRASDPTVLDKIRGLRWTLDLWNTWRWSRHVRRNASILYDKLSGVRKIQDECGEHLRD